MQFARDTAFQRGHPRSGRSGSSRGGIGRCQQHGERTSWGLSPAGQLPPVKSLIKHSHFNSVPLRLGGDGLHKNPDHRVLPLHLPGGSGSPESVQWDQLTNVCREHRLEQPSLGPGARAAPSSREIFKEAAAASPAESCSSCPGRGGTSPGRQRRGHLGSSISGISIVHLELLFRPKFHSFNLSLAPVIPQGHSKHSSTTAQWTRARRHLPAEQERQRSFILLHPPLSSAAPGTPQLGNSWEWDAGTHIQPSTGTTHHLSFLRHRKHPPGLHRLIWSKFSITSKMGYAKIQAIKSWDLHSTTDSRGICQHLGNRNLQ